MSPPQGLLLVGSLLCVAAGGCQQRKQLTAAAPAAESVDDGGPGSSAGEVTASGATQARAASKPMPTREKADEAASSDSGWRGETYQVDVSDLVHPSPPPDAAPDTLLTKLGIVEANVVPGEGVLAVTFALRSGSYPVPWQSPMLGLVDETGKARCRSALRGIRLKRWTKVNAEGRRDPALAKIEAAIAEHPSPDPDLKLLTSYVQLHLDGCGARGREVTKLRLLVKDGDGRFGSAPILWPY